MSPPVAGTDPEIWPEQDTRLVTAYRALLFGALGIVCVGAFVLTLAWGSARIPVEQVVVILFGGEADIASWQVIVWDLRLPRALTAVLAGAAMALAGLQMQTLFRNALAEPFVLGVTAGASLGVGLVLLPQGATTVVAVSVGSGVGPLQSLGTVGAAAVGGFAVLAIMFAVASRVRNVVIVLVAGLMVGTFVTAIVSVLIYFARAEAVAAYTSWQLGSFQGVRWAQLPVLALAVMTGLALMAASTKQLNAYLLGEHYAQSMGMSVRGLRLTAMASTALLSGAVTAYAGPIAFLGIAAPHLARGLFSSADHRILVPASALIGIVLSLVAGVFAEVPGSDIILPLNAALALIGAPVVLRVLLRMNRSGEGFTV